jgi:hypothetical protein
LVTQRESATRDLPWRLLTDRERDLLRAILDQPFPESTALLAQAEVAEARQGCDCGCGTIDLQVDRDSASSVALNGSLAPGEAEVLSETGASEGGLIVFVQDGYLSCLEIYSYGEPAALPAAERIRPHVIAGRSGG